MKILSQDQNSIYESPDGGKTVYSRQIGSKVRTLYTRNFPPRIDPLEANRFRLTYADWIYANTLAEHHPSLQEAIDKFIILYNLYRDHGQT